MNEDVRNRIRKERLLQWEVAAKIGVCEYTLVRWLRCELSDEKRKRILAAIDALVKEREAHK